ncbi:MAG: hypothetical protein HS116_10035 [Planctomycetes bacterium]|nr:hypothetical protein [Planctomycetota bacterium]
MHASLEDLTTLRKLALGERARALAAGPAGRTRVRPAGAMGQPYDVLAIDFYDGGDLSVQPVPGDTAFAYGAAVAIDPPWALHPFSLLWCESPPLELDDAALGGTFLSFVELTLDDASVAALNPLRVSADGGAVYAEPGFLNPVETIGPSRRIVSARRVLQADGPGTATATVFPGLAFLVFFRSREGRFREAP